MHAVGLDMDRAVAATAGFLGSLNPRFLNCSVVVESILPTREEVHAINLKRLPFHDRSVVTRSDVHAGQSVWACP